MSWLGDLEREGGAGRVKCPFGGVIGDVTHRCASAIDFGEPIKASASAGEADFRSVCPLNGGVKLFGQLRIFEESLAVTRDLDLCRLRIGSEGIAIDWTVENESFGVGLGCCFLTSSISRS